MSWLTKVRPHRPSHATVVAYLALFLALGGGTTAVALQGRNTVDSGDIINQEVRSADVRNEAVGGIDVRNGSLVDDDIQNETLTNSDVANNSLGGDDIFEPSLGQVPSAAQAGNASNLNGVPAGDYQRRCQNGTVQSYARVAGSAVVSSTFSTTPVLNGFTCTGSGTVEARRLAQGEYRVRFGGQGVFGSPIAVGSVDSDSGISATGADDFVTITRVTEGGSQVYKVLIRDADGGMEDATFTIAVLT